MDVFMHPAPFLAALLVASAMTGGPARADGFKIHDLTATESGMAAAFDGFRHWTLPEAMTLTCCDDDKSQFVRVTLDRQSDEQGQQDRTDEAYLAALDKDCNRKDMPCRIEEIEAGPALGRRTGIRMAGGMIGVNIIVVHAGDRLRIESAAKEEDVARANSEKAWRALRAPLLDE